MEFGVFCHFGINTFNNLEWSDGTKSPSSFNPTRLDCEQWVRVAKEAGAKYMVLTCKHHDGFCLWQTKTTDYSVKASPYKNGMGDVVAEFVAACRKHGMKFGFYLSPWDRHEPRYKDKVAYDQFYAAQLTELVMQYALKDEIFELWFDGAGSAGREYDWNLFMGVIEQFQPHANRFNMCNPTIRWVGNEGGYAPYPNWNVTRHNGQQVWMPAECDVPIRLRHWFHHVGLWGIIYRFSLMSTKKLVTLYERSIGHGANLLLNLAPTREGLFSKTDVNRVLSLSREIRRRYETPLAGTNGTGTEIVLHLPEPSLVNATIAQEDIREGERVRSYCIEANIAGKWQVVKTLEPTISIGHKKIDKFSFPIHTNALRLVILQWDDKPIIQSFRAFRF